MTVMDVVASFASYRAGFAATYILLAVFALAIHEAGHILSAIALGIRVKQIGITWRGPFIVREQGSPAASAVVSLAGPVLNVILALVYWEASPLFCAHQYGARVVEPAALSRLRWKSCLGFAKYRKASQDVS